MMKKRNVLGILLMSSLVLMNSNISAIYANDTAEESAAEEAIVLNVDEAAGWNVSVEASQQGAELSDISLVLGYTGTNTEEFSKVASEGKEFLLVKLLCEKREGQQVIDWEKVILTDGDGNEYKRIDDVFLVDLNMKRMQGTDLNFGTNEGYIAFEVNEGASDYTLSFLFDDEEEESDIAADEGAGAEDSAAEGTETVIKEDSLLENAYEYQAEVDQQLQAELENGYEISNPLVVLNPYGNSPLSAVVLFSTEEEVAVTITVEGKDDNTDIVQTFDAAQDHVIPVYGLYADAENIVTISLPDGTEQEITIETEALAFDPGEIDMTIYQEDAYDYDQLIFVSNVMGNLYALDSNGDIRWYRKGLGMPFKMLSNGHVMYCADTVLKASYYKSGLVETDLLGKVYNEYVIPGGQHHDFFEMENGNLLVASDEEDFSTVEDTIVELDRETGEVVWSLDMKDLLDYTDGSSINRTDEDWFHNNGIWYVEETDTILLSARHVDAVVGVNKTEKTLEFILGDPEGWENADESLFFTPVGEDFEWQYAQHQVSVRPDGTILMFDNGAGRTKSTAADEEVVGDDVYSRAVAYKIDTEAMTIEQVFEYGKDRGKDWYSEWISGAIVLNGNSNDIWITSGSHLHNTETGSCDYGPSDMCTEGLTQSTIINEVLDGELVCELTIGSLSYRSIRMPMYTTTEEHDCVSEAAYLGEIEVLIEAQQAAAAAASESAQETVEETVVSGTTSVNDQDSIVLETNITQEESQVDFCRKIDEQLTLELESGNYTVENPLVVANPYQNAPLTAVVLFQTEEEVTVKATVQGDDSWDGSDFYGETELATSHRVPVLGLYAGKVNQVVLEMFDAEGNKVDEISVEIQTDPLPESMENLVEVYVSGDDTAMPYTLVTGQSTKTTFVFDKNGEIRWYLTDTTGSYGAFPISGGHFMFQGRQVMVPTYEKPHTVKMYEMDYLGRTHKVYYIPTGWHHEVIEKEEGGNLLVLSSSIDEHVEDTVIEIDRETGKIVKTLDMRDIFDETYEDMIDWAHLNTIDYCEEDNSLILSPRNVHSIIKVDWETNELKWILCNPEFWEGTEMEEYVLEPVGDIIWHFQQHTPYQIEDQDDDPNTIQLMVFDNHWHKTRKVDFYDDDEQSYVLQYTVDEVNMTVSQDHTYGGVKSKITSNFVFMDEEDRVFSMGGYLDPEIDENNGMIYEFDYETEEVINQYGLDKTFYRAYEFAPDYAALAEPMSQTDQVNYGSLDAFEVYSGDTLEAENTLPDDVKMKIIDNVLYVYATDHAVNKIYLQGENSSYVLDFTATLPGEDTYEDVYFYIVAPLTDIEADTYEVFFEYKSELTATDSVITLEK